MTTAALPGQPTRLMRLQEAAQQLGVHTSTIKRMIANGKIKSSRVGMMYMIPRDEVERLLNPGEVTSA